MDKKLEQLGIVIEDIDTTYLGDADEEMSYAYKDIWEEVNSNAYK